MPVVTTETFGHQAEPLVIIDDFHPEPGALMVEARTRLFLSSQTFYPGLQAPAPASSVRDMASLLGPVLRDTFGLERDLQFSGCTFSMVTTKRENLSLSQRLPHFDSTDPNQLAILHYLTDAQTAGGTAFFRHRSTGLECISKAQQPGYIESLRLEVGRHPPAQDYVTEGTDLFELIGQVEAKWNRLVIYRSFRLHSGLIPSNASLSSVIGEGRLTVNTFVRGEPGFA